MASEIRVNQIQNRSGLSTVTFSDTGVVISGITTITDLRASGNTIVAAGSTSAPSISPTGDSNTGIFFPSPDTIAFAEGGVEALRIDSNGRIGINSTSPGTRLDVVGTAKISSYLTMGSWINGTTDLSLYGDVSSSVGVKVKQAGNLEIENGNLVFSTSGKGIDFSATANSNAGMTSELFSDYEEGTWTVVDSSGAGLTLSVPNGPNSYTKVGRLVTAQTQFIIPSTANSTHATVSLPILAGANNLGAGALYRYSDGASVYWHINTNAATAAAYNSTGGQVLWSQISGRRFDITFVYIV
jgi:hypothetical protein